jgi:hypothetical protein
MFGCSSEAWKAEVTKGLVRPPRGWAGWRQIVATLWGETGATTLPVLLIYVLTTYLE